MGQRKWPVFSVKVSRGWIKEENVPWGVFRIQAASICSEKRELLNFMITPGDIEDRKPLEYQALVEFL